ncbi:MAG TPA: tetratricopeptide repeat protein, partial [Thermoanaerobaculia bacterium]
RALAEMFLPEGKFDEGEKAARQALEVTSGLHGAESLEAATTMNVLGDALRMKGGYPGARKLALEALRIAQLRGSAPQQTEAGQIDPRTVELNAVRVLGGVALEQGNFKEQEIQQRRRLEIARSLHPNRHPEIVEALGDYAVALIGVGDLAGAEKVFKETLAMQREVIGEDNAAVATTLENLGGVYLRAKRLDETAKILETVLAMRRKALGEDSEPVARTLANMGTVYMMAGNLEASEAKYAEALPRLSAKLGPTHPDIAATLGSMGMLYTKLRRFPEAESYLRRSLDIRMKAFGETNPGTQLTLKRFADLYIAWDKPTQAAAYSARLVPPAPK